MMTERTMLKEDRASETKRNKIYLIEQGVWIAIFLASTLRFLMLFQLYLCPIMAVSLIRLCTCRREYQDWRLKNEYTRSFFERRAWPLLVIGVVFVVCSQLLSGLVLTRNAWTYQWKKSFFYADRSDDLRHFPDRIPGNAMELMIQDQPTILQGSGHFTVSYFTDETYIHSYIAQNEDAAKLTMTLAEYENGSYLETQKATLSQMGAKTEADNLQRLYVPNIPEQMQEDAANTVLYVLNANFNFNHPRGCGVLINEPLKMVEFYVV